MRSSRRQLSHPRTAMWAAIACSVLMVMAVGFALGLFSFAIIGLTVWRLS